MCYVGWMLLLIYHPSLFLSTLTLCYILSKDTVDLDLTLTGSMYTTHLTPPAVCLSLDVVNVLFIHPPFGLWSTSLTMTKQERDMEAAFRGGDVRFVYHTFLLHILGINQTDFGFD